jgi:DNA-binding NarL/FixJ family response regulator
LNMPKMNGIDLILNIRLKQLPIKILVVSMVNDASVILKALDAGANGFLPKNTQFEELKTALQMIENEQVFIPESMQFAVDNARRLHDMNWEDRNIDQKIVLLSAREREIMQLIAKGYSNTQIGETLFLSPLTVKTHRSNILRKLGLKNSIALALFANSLESGK